MKRLILKYTYKTKEGQKWGKIKTVSQATLGATGRFWPADRSLHSPVIKGQRSETIEAGNVERILQFSTVFDKEKYVLKC